MQSISRPRPRQMLQSVLLAGSLLAGFAWPGTAQTGQPSSPASTLKQGDATFTDYKFRDGEMLPQLRIHYVTLGSRHRDSHGTVDNAVLLLHWTNASSQALLGPEAQQALFAQGAPLDTTRFFVIIPDDIGHGRSSKPSDGLKASFPHYGYGDMVDLQHKLVVDSLAIPHLHAIIGMSMGCMNAWQWAESYPAAVDGIMPVACFPAAISGRNLLWRRILIEGIKSDPLWQNGNYQKQPPSGAAGFTIARMMIDGVPALQQEVRSPEAADALLAGIKSQADGLDTNDLLYAFDSSRDFDAEPGLGQIQGKVFALNFADDEFYRDSLNILEQDIKRVPQGRLSVRPVTAGSVGHLSMSHPALWKDQTKVFMDWLDTENPRSSLSSSSSTLRPTALLNAGYTFEASRSATVDGPGELKDEPAAQVSQSNDQTRGSKTFKGRVGSYVFDAFGPGAFLFAGIQSGIDQARPLKNSYPADGFSGAGKHPAHGSVPEWEEGSDGYAKRYASQYGQILIGTSIRYGLGELLREDVTYHRCACVGFGPRMAHVLTSPLVAYTKSGRAVPSLPALVSPFLASEIAVKAWYPARYDSSDALRTSAALYYTLPVRNIFNEFARR